MLAVSDVIRNDRLAQLYARVLELDSPTVEELAEGIESSTTTVYEDIKHLVEIGLLSVLRRRSRTAIERAASI